MPKPSLRKQIFILLLVITPLGFLCKLYSGPLDRWFNDYCAGILYEIFWILVIFLIFPKKNLVNKIPILVFIITGILEALQLWHPSGLERLRQTFLGKALVGTTFTLWDFPHYAVGCIIGWILLRKAAKHLPH
ncbi:DUF2809 domain-containing protein [Candidatus Omnitrophota bacterium]